MPERNKTQYDFITCRLFEAPKKVKKEILLASATGFGVAVIGSIFGDNLVEKIGVYSSTIPALTLGSSYLHSPFHEAIDDAADFVKKIVKKKR